MKNFCFLVFLLFAGHFAFAQRETALPLVQSPNAASLGKYGKIDISPFTGIPNVRVPVFSYTYGDIPINAELRYFAGGVKLEEHPSWVGQNWSLSVGGIVTRKTNGGVDELYSISGDHEKYSYFAHASSLGGTNWDSSSEIISRHNQKPLLKFEPDEFMFSLPNGRSGSFMMNHLGNWVVKSEQGGRLQVTEVRMSAGSGANVLKLVNPTSEAYQQNLSRVIDKIVIRDDQGFTYTFGNHIDAIEFVRSSSSSSGDPVEVPTVITASAWNLTCIQSPTGRRVNFRYARGTYQLIQNVEISSIANSSGIGPSQSNTSSGLTYSGQMITPSFLKEIECPAFKIVFNRSLSKEIKYPYELSEATKHSFDNFDYLDILKGPGKPLSTSFGKELVAANPHQDWKLSQIVVFGPDQKQIQEYEFQYNNDNELVQSQRLFLKAFMKKGRVKDDGDVVYNETARYNFKYNRENELPGYNTMKVDEWGYYNNKPFPNPFSQSAFINKLIPDTAYSKIGSLTEIQYPTGGRTRFTYESNSYSNYIKKTPAAISLVAQSGTGAGLRIRKIEHLSDENRDSITYRYTDVEGQSSGILAGKKVMYFVSYLNAEKTIFASSMSYSGMYDLNYTEGRDVVYSRVKETLQDGSSIIYNYANSDDTTRFMDDVSPSTSQGILFSGISGNQLQPDSDYPFAPHNSRQMERGKLLSKVTYSNLNRLVAKEVHTYNSQPERFDQFVRSIKSRITTISGGAVTASQLYLAPTKIYTYYPWLASTTSFQYDTLGNEVAQQITRYTYDRGYGALRDQLTSNSANDSLRTRNSYAFDISNSTTARMIDSNMVAIPLKSEQFNNGQLIKSQTTDYSLQAGNLAPSNSKIYLGQTISESRDYSHNAQGNMIAHSRNQGATTGYQWGYGGQYLVAMAVNASPTEFYHENFEESSLAQVSSTAAHTGRKALQQSSYLLNWTLPNLRAYVLSYWYLEGGKWKFSPPATFNGTATLSGGSAYDDIAIYPADAQLTTYTHHPLVGVTSEIDVAGKSTYYTYDQMDRLSAIKDQDGNIVRSFSYRLYNDVVGQPSVLVYYNSGRTAYATKNCPTGKVGTVVGYTVERKKYSSTISQQAADQLQENDITAHVQRNADLLGGCSVTAPTSFSNDRVTVYRNRNTCGEGTIGSEIAYTVDSGKYFATTKQLANAQALEFANANAQGHANQYGICIVQTPKFNFAYTIPSPASLKVTFTDVQRGVFQEYLISGSARTIPTPGEGSGSITITDLDPQTSTYTFTLNGRVITGSQAKFDNVGFSGTINLAVERTSVYLYYNNALSSTKMAICKSGETAYEVTYPVEARKHSSPISKAAADLLAQQDLEANAQNYANANGCKLTAPAVPFYSAAKTVVLTRNTCEGGLNGETYTYTVPAGRYSSTISQQAADQKVLDDIATKGQQEANESAGCTNIPLGSFPFVVSTPVPSFFKIIFNYSNGATKEIFVAGQNITITVPGSGTGSVIIEDTFSQVSNYNFTLNGVSTSGPGATFNNVQFSGGVNLTATRTSIFYFYNYEVNIKVARNTCGAGMVGALVPYFIPARKYSSTVSQYAADQLARAETDAYAQTIANEQGGCLIKYFNTEQQLTKTRNDCQGEEVGSAHTLVVGANSYWSTISQADANKKALDFLEASAQINANGLGTCAIPTVYYSAAHTVTRKRNNCEAYFGGSTVPFTVYQGTFTSLISQQDADQKALDHVNANAQQYANTNGTCSPINTFYSTPMWVSKTKNNCPPGSTPGTFTYYAVPQTSYISQEDANRKAQEDIDANAQAVVNANAPCTPQTIYRNDYMQVIKTRNNCTVPQIPSGTVTYWVQQGKYTSTISQADANQKAQADLVANAQNHANTNGVCMLPSPSISYQLPGSTAFTITLNRDGNATSYQISGTGTLPAFTAGTYYVVIFPTDDFGPFYNYTLAGNTTTAASMTQNIEFVTGSYQLTVAPYAQTYYNPAMSVSLSRNNCTGGQVGSTVTYTVAAGTYSSTTSQAAANALAQADLDANGQNYANTNGTCSTPVVYYNTAMAVTKTRNNCGSGQTGTSVTYTVAAGTYSSTTSQAAANALAQADLDANGQNYANTNGTCSSGTVYWNTYTYAQLARNNCAIGLMSGPRVVYHVYANTHSSTISQADANQKAQADIAANAQNYANANGTCVSSTFSIEYNIPTGSQFQIVVNTSSGTNTYFTSGTSGVISGIPAGMGYVTVYEVGSSNGYYYTFGGLQTGIGGTSTQTGQSEAHFEYRGLSGNMILSISEYPQN